jgi:hypothetical protein
VAKPFSQLPSILQKRQKQFERGVDQISRKGANAAGTRAVTTTPVDTGLLRSNWIASVGAPSSYVQPAYSLNPKGSRVGKGESANATGVLTQQRSVVNSVWVPTKQVPLFITNNVPYAFYQNFGANGGKAHEMLANAREAWRAQIQNTRKVFID